MKRNCVALCIQPFTDSLQSREAIKSAVSTALETIINLVNTFPNLRFNLIFPAVLLEQADPILLSQSRELMKRGTLEWLTTGYTEPFLSLSPMWLSRQNIQTGVETIQQILGCKISGYVPPFSNWEPAVVDILTSLGLHYSVLSTTCFSEPARATPGIWATEYQGTPMTLFPVHSLHHYTAPADCISWFNRRLAAGPAVPGTALVGIRYLFPIDGSSGPDFFSWFSQAATALEQNVLKLQTVCFSDYLNENVPVGLHYPGSNLDYSTDQHKPAPPFRNWLFTHDQAGLLHRKLIDVSSRARSDQISRVEDAVAKKLFFLQDINRFLPGKKSGFTNTASRSRFFSQAIELENELFPRTVSGGQIKIADYLRNGSKSILMSNKSLRACIDHRNGGTLYELDLFFREANILSAFNPENHTHPAIIVPGKSFTAFRDHFFTESVTLADFIGNTVPDLGDFETGRFEYTIKKSTRGVKTILSRQGGIELGGKTCPLTLEKVFALENESGQLSFAYRMMNNSLASYAFLFAVECAFCFPGVRTGGVRIFNGKSVYKKIHDERIRFNGVTDLTVEDRLTGIGMKLSLQKPVDIWCFPASPSRLPQEYTGTRIVLSAETMLDGNSSRGLMGKLLFKKIRRSGKDFDAL